MSCLLSGFSVVSCDTQYSKRVFSTRTEERSPRIYIKDYFGMRPRATTKVYLFCPFHMFRCYIYFYLIVFHSPKPRLRAVLRWLCQNMSEESNQVMQRNMYLVMCLLQAWWELKLFIRCWQNLVLLYNVHLESNFSVPL